MTEQIVDAARSWIEGDPDPQTREELSALIEANDLARLSDQVGNQLHFGTAGLRAVMGAGPNRINRAVVIKATAGLAEWLHEQGADGPVIVGYDGRLNSQQFASDTVAVLDGAGIGVIAFDEAVPTPLVAYAARALEAVAAVAITASHNPPQYNGYKVYGGNWAQILPPADLQIAAAMGATGPAIDVPLGEDNAEPLHTWQIFDSYWSELEEARFGAGGGLSLAYTPMHGVGGRFAVEALRRAGHGEVVVVPEQAEPDGHFPTVALPNPEEPGAMDMVKDLASRTGADLVLANDPDADRLAVAVPAAGSYRSLTGDQVGVLLADYLLDNSTEPNPLLVSSVVSSPMAGSVAASHAARWEQTLTGFKWVVNAALELERSAGMRLILGYEEALGYTVGTVVRDKDGISATVAFADLSAGLQGDGLTPVDRLGQLYVQHGLWVNSQLGIALEPANGTNRIEDAMNRLRRQPPATLGRRAVLGCDDYRDDAADRPMWLASAELLSFELEGGRALVRPSGTEPKVKIYVDLRYEVLDMGEIPAAEAAGYTDAHKVASELAAAAGFR